eukprot:GILI01002634.1.p1 GENE.GILI01002634.1~~GILI01002634.1.p1  ORF type:complete len:100 (+),score=12.70 GILI01002634.1:34-333(+)
MTALRRPFGNLRMAFSRSYTDYHHIKYPVIYELALGVPAYWIMLYILFVRAGSMASNRNQYKEDIFRGWKRRLGTGYKWSTEWGAPIESYHKNLPSGAE